MTSDSKKFFLFSMVIIAIAVVVVHRLKPANLNTPAANQQSESGGKDKSASLINNSDFSLLTKSQQTESVSSSGPKTQIENSAADIGATNQNQANLVPVVRVVDGDTIVVNINSQDIHVRLIGINSPELKDKRARVACFAQKAKEEAEKLLNGRNVTLEKDSTQGDYDKYGRTLAYILLTDGTNFNRLMIEKGYAYEYTYRLPYKYQAEFKTAHAEAKAEQKGLWGNAICGS